MQFDARPLIKKLIEANNAHVERFIRDYLKSHRTTRLDIELVTSEFRIASHDDAVFMLRADADQYEVRCYRDVGIRQRLPCKWRPALPG